MLVKQFCLPSTCQTSLLICLVVGIANYRKTITRTVEMIRNGKGISVFTLAAILLCISSVKFYLVDGCLSTIAKNIKSKDNKAKDSQTKNKSSIKSESSVISDGHNGDWRKKSLEAAMLVFHKKYADADSIFVKILPIARKEDPNGVDLGVCLLRYGSGLTGEKKYQQAIVNLEEGLKVMQKTLATKRQKKAIFQILKTMSIAYMLSNQFDKGEKFARRAIAYRIAFPDISSLSYFKSTYEGLRICLVNQKKSDEASVVGEIIKTLS